MQTLCITRFIISVYLCKNIFQFHIKMCQNVCKCTHSIYKISFPPYDLQWRHSQRALTVWEELFHLQWWVHIKIMSDSSEEHFSSCETGMIQLGRYKKRKREDEKKKGSAIKGRKEKLQTYKTECYKWSVEWQVHCQLEEYKKGTGSTYEYEIKLFYEALSHSK